MKLHIKRAYEPSAPEDGERFLVDRLWPRGVKKKALALTGWLKEVAPVVGGGGGGRPDMAQAGGKDPSRIPEALDKALASIRDKLSA